MGSVFCIVWSEKEIQALVNQTPSLLSQEGLSDFKWMKAFLRTCHILFFFDVSFLSQMWSLFTQCTTFVRLALISQPLRWSCLIAVCAMWFVLYWNYKRSRNSVYCLYAMFFSVLISELTPTALYRSFLQNVSGITIAHGTINVEGKTSTLWGMRS